MLKRLGFLSILVLAAAAILFVSGCGSGGGHNPPPPLTGLTIYPSSVTLTQGQTAQLTAYLGATATSATWSVTSGTGTINASTGLFTAPTASETDTIQAVSGSNGGTATIVVSGSAQSVIVNPSAIAIPAGAQQTFSTTTAGVTWEVNGVAGGDSVHGFITTGGVYTTPLTPPPGGSTTISAVSGANSGTATATILFSNASLNSYVSPFTAANPQPYAFAYTGDDGSGFLSAAGSFVADGNGNIVSGVEDVIAADLTNPASDVAIHASTYTVGPDGRTTANITTDLGTGIVWQFTLISNQHALMIRFDVATGSGTIDLQDPTQFSTPFSAGTYAFSFSGAAVSNSSLFPAGVVGRFSTGGGMSIPLSSAILDINDTAPSAPITTDSAVTGSFQAADPATGRGMLTLDCPTFDISAFFGSGAAGSGNLTFVYYIIDATHVKIVEDDTIALFAGDIYSAPVNPMNANLDTSAFVVGGSDTNGNPYGLGGVFVTSGGNGSGGVLDINDAGNLNGGGSVANGESITSTSATLDTTTGRVALTISASGQSYQFAAYSFTYNTSSGSPSTGSVMLETDSNIAEASGIAYTQSGTTTPQGSFALNLTGIAASGGGEQDVTGQFATGSSGALTGTLDINDVGNSGNIVSGAPLTSGSTITPVIANGRGNPLTLAAVNPSYVLSYYVIDDNTALLLEMDGDRVMTGTIARQF